MTVKRIPILFFLLLSSLLVHGQGQPFIIDNAQVLTKEENSDLNFILNGYYNESGLEFVLFTTKSLGDKTPEQYSRMIMKNFGIGRTGINNGLLVLLVPSEKKVHMEIGSGLQWQITDAKKSGILRESKGYFAQEDYFQGIRNSFITSYDLVRDLNWAVQYESFTQLGYSLKMALNQIVVFQGSTTNRNIIHPKKGPQFDSKYYIPITGENKKTARLYYSIDMLPMVEKIISQSNTKIYARVTRTGPVRLDLLGIE